MRRPGIAGLISLALVSASCSAAEKPGDAAAVQENLDTLTAAAPAGKLPAGVRPGA